MVPFWTLSTLQPWCVQIALNALKSPALGWVTTTACPPASTILPPPTGMSAVLAIAPAPPPAPLPVVWGVSVLAAGLLPPEPLPVLAGSPLSPQAARPTPATATAPATAAVRITERRLTPSASD
jgi:hypothetical protein